MDDVTSTHTRRLIAAIECSKQANAPAQPAVHRLTEAGQAARSPGPHVQLGGQGIGPTAGAPLWVTSAAGVLPPSCVLFSAFGPLLPMPLPPVTAIAGV